MDAERIDIEKSVLEKQSQPIQYELSFDENVLWVRFYYLSQRTSQWYRILIVCSEFPNRIPQVSISGVPDQTLDDFYHKEFSNWSSNWSLHKMYCLCVDLIDHLEPNTCSSSVTAPIYAISPHRVGTDGFGVCTLVGFYECPLNCKLCINPKSRVIPSDVKQSTPFDVYNTVRHDDILFRATTGGVTFGGGEPCLYSKFIEQFSLHCSPKWKLRIETSLNVPTKNILSLLSTVDEWLVDIKILGKDKYLSYSGKSNNLVFDNLKTLLRVGIQKKVIIRIPIIDGFCDRNEANQTQEIIKKMGFENVQIYTYHNPSEIKVNRKSDCEAVRFVRNEIARLNDITISDTKCPSKTCDRGTCEVCENILNVIKQQLSQRNNSQPIYVDSILPDYVGVPNKLIENHEYDCQFQLSDLVFDPVEGEFKSCNPNRFGFGMEDCHNEVEIITEMIRLGGFA